MSSGQPSTNRNDIDPTATIEVQLQLREKTNETA